MPTPQSDAGCAVIARARRRGLLGKFGGRGGVRRRAGMQFRGATVGCEAWADSPAIATGPEKKEFIANYIPLPGRPARPVPSPPGASLVRGAHACARLSERDCACSDADSAHYAVFT